MRKLICLSILLVVVVLFWGCASKYTSQGNVAQLPEGILVENEIYTTERKDGWLYITYHQNPPFDEGYGVSWISGALSFSSLKETWDYFESGWFDTEVHALYDALALKLAFSSGDFELGKPIALFNANAFYEPVLPESWMIPEKSEVKLFGANNYYYEYDIEPTDTAFDSGRIRCFFRAEDYSKAYEKGNDTSIRSYSLKGSSGIVRVFQYSDKTVEVYGEFFGCLASVTLTFSEKVSKPELRTFFRNFNLKPYGTPDPEPKTSSTSSLWIVFFGVVVTAAIVTVLLLRRKKAKAALGASGGAEPLEEPPESPEPSEETPESPGPDSEDPSEDPE